MATATKSVGNGTVGRSLFLHNLRESGLLADDQLDYLRAQVNTRDTTAFAELLLAKGWLTPYQLNRILEGRPRGLALGQYQVLGELGAGGFGKVYKAVHGILNRLAAVKVSEGDLARAPKAQAIFFHEVLATTRLTHPNIATVYEAGRADDLLWFAMEFVDGPTLEDYVTRQGPLPVPYACAVVHQVARALQFAHENGVVHRDIKPANLLLPKACLPPGPPAAPSSPPVLVKVVDFGLARLLPEAGVPAVSLCGEGGCVGTPEYVSPEQARDSHHVDIRSDLYSLGCTFYFALTGRPPFRGASDLGIITQHLEAEPEPLLQVRPEVPPAVAHLVHRLMAKDRDHRFATPAELVRALSLAVLDSRPQTSGLVAVPPAEASPGDAPASPSDGGQEIGRAPAAGPEPGPEDAPASEDAVSAWWREWLSVVEALSQTRRPSCTEREYAALQGRMLKGARALSASSSGERSRLFVAMESLVEPWVSMHSLADLDRRTLGGILQTCRRLDAELFGPPGSCFAVLIPLLGLVVALASFVLGFLYLGHRP